jgi:hypothetical protein
MFENFSRSLGYQGKLGCDWAASRKWLVAPIRVLDKSAGPLWNVSAPACHRFCALLEFRLQLACMDLATAVNVLFVFLAGAIIWMWEF